MKTAVRTHNRHSAPAVGISLHGKGKPAPPSDGAERNSGVRESGATG